MRIQLYYQINLMRIQLYYQINLMRIQLYYQINLMRIQLYYQIRSINSKHGLQKRRTNTSPQNSQTTSLLKWLPWLTPVRRNIVALSTSKGQTKG